jgi:hypothetical protein
VEDDLQKILRSTRPKPDEAARKPEVERQHEEAGALFSRLRFVRLFYQGPILQNSISAETFLDQFSFSNCGQISIRKQHMYKN